MKVTKDILRLKSRHKRLLSLMLACCIAFSLAESVSAKAFHFVEEEEQISSCVLMGKSIEEATVSSIADKAYTGSSITPSVIVKNGSTVLKKGTDYLLYYSNNKSIGKATISVAGMGKYVGTKKVTFKIVPKKVSINTPTSKKDRVATMTWDKISYATGYEVSYSKSSTGSFKTAGTTKEATYKIEKLTSDTTYYVRVRAYKTVDSTKYYGAYSTVHSIKVK